MPARSLRPARLFPRAFAALGVALVLALGVFGASGTWHAALHSADHAHAGEVHPAGGDRCAVELFAGGVSMPLEVPAAVDGPVLRSADRSETAREPWLTAPEYRLRPGRGPPRA